VVLEPYRGTAVPDDLLILSGQALYRMVRPAARRRRRPARAAAPAQQPGPAGVSAAVHSVSRWGSGVLTQRPASCPGHAVSGGRMPASARRCHPRRQARCSGAAPGGKRAPRAQDYGQLIRTHREADADITICTNSVGWEMAPRRGLARVNPDTGARPPRAGRARAPGARLFAQAGELERGERRECAGAARCYACWQAYGTGLGSPDKAAGWRVVACKTQSLLRTPPGAPGRKCIDVHAGPPVGKAADMSKRRGHAGSCSCVE